MCHYFDPYFMAYTVRTKTDTGCLNVHVGAASAEAAKIMVMKAYHCPESAIKRVWEKLPKECRPTRATRLIWAKAREAYNAGCVVSDQSPLSAVAIDWDDGEAFMQDHEAEEFMAEVEELCKRYPSLPEDVAELYLAAFIIEAHS
jgi:hypothetical protein